MNDALPHLLVCGGRAFADAELLATRLDLHTRDLGPRLVVVTGACPRGADRLAEDWAHRHRHVVLRFHADWDVGLKAGPLRNEEMVAYCAAREAYCTAFWDGKSKGTKDCIARVKAHGIPLKIVRYG